MGRFPAGRGFPRKFVTSWIVARGFLDDLAWCFEGENSFRD
jgi:hypothetical protein